MNNFRKYKIFLYLVISKRRMKLNNTVPHIMIYIVKYSQYYRSKLHVGARNNSKCYYLPFQRRCSWYFINGYEIIPKKREF